VSFYNESRGRDIDPTPIVGLLGVVDELDRRPPGLTLVEGGRLLLLGDLQAPLAGSRWAWTRELRNGSLGQLDADAHAALCSLVRELVTEAVVLGVHDAADGGILAALGEMAVCSSIGFDVDGFSLIEELFGEHPSRAIVCVAPELVDDVTRRAIASGVPVAELGVAGGDRMVVRGWFDLAVNDAASAWRDRLPTALAGGTMQ
jgi:phosphoribosylformylglycinamidine synthase